VEINWHPCISIADVVDTGIKICGVINRPDHPVPGVTSFQPIHVLQGLICPDLIEPGPRCSFQVCFFRAFFEAAHDNAFELFAELQIVFPGRFRGVGLAGLPPIHGIGLPVSRQLARSMGGDIKIASRERHGTVVTIELPIEEEIT